MKNRMLRFVPIALLAVACLYTYRLDDSKTHTYPAGIRVLSVQTKNGDIHVALSAVPVITVVESTYAYGRDRADAEQAIRNVVYRDTIIGTNLMVKESMPGGSRPYGANLTITAPESTGLSLWTTNGDVSVAPGTGALNAVGAINVATTNGRVELTGTVGTASVATTNGKLDVKVHSGAFYGATTNGAVDCDVAALGPTEDVALATTNGKVTLLLPADVSALIDATNTSGLLTIYDFTVTYEVQDEHYLRARIGSGASTINITTTNGDVVVRRRS